MPYKYLEDTAVADAAFEAWGKTREELFSACAQAAMNVMVRDLNSIENKHEVTIDIEEEDLETLLVRFLEEIIYYKDVYRILLKPKTVQIEWEGEEERYFLIAHMEGEPVDLQKHPLSTDIKAVAHHRSKVTQEPGGWRATVVLDV